MNLSVFGLLRTIRFDEILKLTENNLKARANILYWLNILLTHPFIYGLRKTTVYPSELKDRASMLYQIPKIGGKAFFVPCWLADVYTNLGTTIPDRMDIDEINAVRKHGEDFARALKSLDEEIDKAVREKFGGGELDRNEKEGIISKKEELRKRWFEDMVPAFKDLSFRKTVWSIAMTGSIVTSVMALSAFQGILDLPKAIGTAAFAPGIKKLVDPAAEFLSTFFECNPIHLGFYKVHRELKKVRQRRGN